MPMIVFAGQPTVLSTMKIGNSGAHVGLDTYTVESIRLLPGLSCDTVGLPVRFSIAIAPAMSVTRVVTRRFLLLLYR
jgi:hypothetical protein